jgi:DNA repair protein SbcD/Mre11
MRLVYFTDPHIKGVNPESRLDHFPTTILKKLEWVGKYAEEIKAEAVICGGDFFDTPSVAPSVVSETIKVLNEWKVPLYGVLGNHDVIGYNPETWWKVPIGILVNAEYYNRLYGSGPLMIGDALITGVDAHYKLDQGDIADYTKINHDGTGVKIHIVHGFLVEKPCIFSHTLIESVLDTEADIVLTGHDHCGFGVKKINGKIFCNPGALGRVTAGVGDVNRDVNIVVIDTEAMEVILVKVPDDIARPSDEVLDRKKLLQEKENAEHRAEFTERLSGFSSLDTFNIYNALQSFCKEYNPGEKIEKVMLEHIRVAEEELKEEE